MFGIQTWVLVVHVHSVNHRCKHAQLVSLDIGFGDLKESLTAASLTMQVYIPFHVQFCPGLGLTQTQAVWLESLKGLLWDHLVNTLKAARTPAYIWRGYDGLFLSSHARIYMI